MFLSYKYHDCTSAHVLFKLFAVVSLDLYESTQYKSLSPNSEVPGRVERAAVGE